MDSRRFLFLFVLAVLTAVTLCAGVENPADSRHRDEAQLVRSGQSRIHLPALSIEPDPDVRRHLLFELSLAPREEVEYVLRSLLAVFPSEPDEKVRLAYLPAVATLLEKTDPGALRVAAADFLRRCAATDPSNSVRILAFNILSFTGMADPSTLPRITRVEGLDPGALHGLPAALLRVNATQSPAILRSLAVFDQDPLLALETAACLQQLGDLTPADLIGKARGIVEAVGDEKTAVKAAAILLDLSQRQPKLGGAVTEVLQEWQERGAESYSGPVFAEMLEKHGIPRTMAVLAYTPSSAYAYAADWWDSCNHSCSSSYSSCTPWSYWGSEMCGYASHGGDCADFVSQCLIAGGHGYLNSGDPCRGYPCGKEEIGATKLGQCLVQKGWTRSCGYKQAPPSNIAVGDVLIYHGGSCSDYDAHATFVMYVSGSDVRIACHSSMQWNKAYTYLAGTKPYYEWLHNPNASSETVSAPAKPTGTAACSTNTSYTYTTSGGASSSGHTLQYSFDWGDGTSSGWLAAGVKSASHSWTAAGTYSVKARARCATHTSIVSAYSAALSVTVTVPCTDPYESNNTSTAAYGPITAGTTYNGKICTSGDVDWFKITTASKGTLAITCTVPSGKDFDLELYNPNWVAGSYNAAGVTESISTNQPAGTYYVRVYGDGGAYSSTAYGLRYTFTPDETVSAPSTPTGTTACNTTSTYTYSVSGGASSLGHTLQYYLDWGDGTNSGWLATGVKSATHKWSAKGTYSVKAWVRCASHTSVASGYSGALTVTVTAPCTDPYEPNNYSSEAKAVSSGVSYAGYLCTSGDVDWFKFTVASQKTVTLTCQVPSGTDYEMELYNPDYVTGSYNAPGSTESISRTLAAGTYYVRIYGYSGAYNPNAPFTLKVVY